MILSQNYREIRDFYRKIWNFHSEIKEFNRNIHYDSELPNLVSLTEHE